MHTLGITITIAAQLRKKKKTNFFYIFAFYQFKQIKINILFTDIRAAGDLAFSCLKRAKLPVFCLAVALTDASLLINKKTKGA